MGELLLLIGFFLFPVYLVQLIIAVVTKWPIESYLTGLAVSGLALVIGFCLVAVGVEFSPVEIIIAVIIILVVAFRDKLLALLFRWWDVVDRFKAKLGIKEAAGIVAVKYLGTETRPAQGSRGRIVLTNLLFGFMESLFVASMEGHDVYHRFAVQYDDGSEKVLECYENTEIYHKLMAYTIREDKITSEEPAEIEPYCSAEDLVELDLYDIDEFSGEEFEEFCAELLQEIGFENVRLTPHSGDQGVDILAEKQGVKYAFQCKNYSSPLGNKPVQEVNAGKSFYKCHVGVVITNSCFTPGAVALAEATGVLLWDRKIIEELLN